MAYDFRGRTTTQVRQVFTDIETEADWTGLEAETSLTGIAAWLGADGSLDAETFSMATTYDALDRVVEQVAPDASRTVPGYDAGGQLVSVDVYLRGSATATAFVTAITYNARGQREIIAYGNGTTSTSTYDPQRFWLTRLKTIGAATLQDLQYTHDAVGNITQITDGAQQTVFFANAQVTPDRTFGYDALYRLVSATHP